MDIGAEQIVRTAQGISDFGMMAMMAGAYLLLSVALTAACFMWFKNIIDNIITKNTDDMKSLLEKQDEQRDLLVEIADGLRPTTLLQVKTISNTCFDKSVEEVIKLVHKVRKENHIANTDATKAKIRTLLRNIHEDRNSRWDNFRFHGHTLTHYSSEEWIEWVALAVETEVYSQMENESRTRTNIEAVYSRIRLDFYHHLTGV